MVVYRGVERVFTSRLDQYMSISRLDAESKEERKDEDGMTL